MLRPNKHIPHINAATEVLTHLLNGLRAALAQWKPDAAPKVARAHAVIFKLRKVAPLLAGLLDDEPVV